MGKGSASGYSSVDDIIASGYYILSQSAGLEKSNGLLIVTSIDGNCYHQMFIDFNNTVESRFKWYSNAWSNWKQL